MVDVDKAVIARLKKGDHIFEVLVGCEEALAFREDRLDLDEVLAAEDIYKDVKKGQHANEHELKKFFGSSDKKKVVEVIIREGEIQLTTEYKNKLREEKKKQIARLIARGAINPKTGNPHPIDRILSVMDEIKVKIDEFKLAEDQVFTVIKSLREVLPITYEIREILFIIPGEFTGKCYSILKRSCTILKEDWRGNELYITVEVPASLQVELYDELNDIAHGRIESKVVNAK